MVPCLREPTGVQTITTRGCAGGGRGAGRSPWEHRRGGYGAGGEEGLGKLPTPNGFQLRPEWAWELLVGVRRGGFLAEGGTGARPEAEPGARCAAGSGSGCLWRPGQSGGRGGQSLGAGLSGMVMASLLYRASRFSGLSREIGRRKTIPMGVILAAWRRGGTCPKAIL